MTIEKKITYKSYIINQYYNLSFCTQVEKVKDGNIISSLVHYKNISPVDDYSNELPEIKAICDEQFTPEVKDTYSAFLESQKQIYTRDELILRARARYNTQKEKEYISGFEYAGNMYDTKGRSAELIKGAADIASMNSSYTRLWTLADDSKLLLNATQLIELKFAMYAAADIIFDKYSSLKDDLENKTDDELKLLI